jgi:hypothetical protein
MSWPRTAPRRINLNAEVAHQVATTDHTASDVLAPFFGRRTPGGCHACDAVQLVGELGTGAFFVTVEHAVGCPWIADYDRWYR